MMNKPTEELMKEEENRPKPHLIVDNVKTAGKLPPEGHNWLDNLEVGTNFYCLEKNSNNFVMPQFVLMEKVEADNEKVGMGSLLLSFLPGETKPVPVINSRFCNRFTYHSTACIHKPMEEDQDEPLNETEE